MQDGTKKMELTASAGMPVTYRVTGMDCGKCAAKVQNAVSALPGIREARVSIASGEMSLLVDDPDARLAVVESTVAGLGYKLSRLDLDDDDGIPDLSHVTPAYRRALWIVVILNAGYGLIEIVGGFLAGSQAVQADALDFIGDGLISWLGLLAIGWGLAARAKAALLQAGFLAALGFGVLGSTLYRFLVTYTPEAELMGVFGLIAMGVNILAVLVLIPHRAGDSNGRAVWLFSRNDAIGNFAVVVAAGLVAWTGTAWPDLVVAVVIAALFLQSSLSIIRDARRDLAHATSRRPA